MYVLYGHPYSQHSRRVEALLGAAGLPYRRETVDLDAGEHHTEEFLRLNPNHQVPVLVDGAFRLTESNAILRYLCYQHGLDEWYPTEPSARALVDQWLDWNQCRLSPVVVDIVLNGVFLGENGDQAAIERGRQALPELAAILECSLEEQQWLVSARPTIADLSVASNITQLSFAKAAPDSANVSAWYARVCAIESFGKVLPEAA